MRKKKEKEREVPLGSSNLCPRHKVSKKHILREYTRIDELENSNNIRSVDVPPFSSPAF